MEDKYIVLWTERNGRTTENRWAACDDSSEVKSLIATEGLGTDTDAFVIGPDAAGEAMTVQAFMNEY